MGFTLVQKKLVSHDIWDLLLTKTVSPLLEIISWLLFRGRLNVLNLDEYIELYVKYKCMSSTSKNWVDFCIL